MIIDLLLNVEDGNFQAHCFVLLWSTSYVEDLPLCPEADLMQLIILCVRLSFCKACEKAFSDEVDLQAFHLVSKLTNISVVNQ